MLEKLKSKSSYIIWIVFFLLILLFAFIYFNKTPNSNPGTVVKNNTNWGVTEQGIEYEYKKKGEEVIKGKYCKLENCKLSNKDLETFLKNKGVTELQIRGEEKIISEETLLKYNIFLSLENDKSKQESSILKDNKLYKFDRNYKIKEIANLDNKEDINNYINLRNILEVCVNETYKDLESCYKKSALTFSYSENWKQFAIDNKLEEQLNNIKGDETKRNEVLGKVNEKIKAFEEKKETSGDNKLIDENVLEVLKDY